MAAAAAVLLAVGVARTRDAAAPGAARVYATAVGVRDSVELPDGTRVLLAPASRLVVAAGYGGAHRDATLEGAASFVVRHDAARPFTVRAGAALVRDLGTAFAVRTDGAGGAGGVTVAVTEGVVALRPATPATAADTGVLLNAGDRGVLRAGAAAEAARGAVTADDVAWTRGRLVYRDAPLDELRADLRRWYGVELRVDDPALAGRRLTATFDGEPADRVLDVVATALGAEVERTGGAAVLRSARAGRASGRPR
jgi:transmembrane sensor